MLNFSNYLQKININNYLLISLAFFLTISIYITDIIIILLFLSWLWGGNFKRKIRDIYKAPFIYTALCFFIYFLISYLWSNSPIWNTSTQKQLLLLLLPVLYGLDFKEHYVEKAKYAFIFGLIINILLSIFTIFVPSNPFFKKGHYDSNIFIHGFLDHFDYSVFLCFGLFLILSLLKRGCFWKYFLLFGVFFITLLNSYGRTGIVALFLFSPIIILIFIPRPKSYFFLIALLSFSFISYYFFSPLKIRVNETINNIQLLKNGISFEEKLENDAAYMASKSDTLSKEYFVNEILKNNDWVNTIKNKNPQYETSIGKRYLYVKNSFILFKEKPLFGFGANEFKKIYMTRFSTNESISHPHNNFIFVLVELGLVGFFLMLYLFYSQLKLFFITKEVDFLKLIFPLYFLFIMLFDNYFLNHNTLAFFCLFSFLIYIPKKKFS